MKKLIIALIIAMTMQTTVFADFADVSYTYDEEYTQTLASGLEYPGYSGVLKFSVISEKYDSAGAELTFDDGLYPYEKMDLQLVSKSDDGNYFIRLKGRGLIPGDYTLTPYTVIDGEKVYGETVAFVVGESCVAMSNLRIAYSQITDLIEADMFTADELEIVNYIMEVAERVIADGEKGNAITKEYVRANYAAETSTVKQMYDALGASESDGGKKTRIRFAGKFGEKYIDKQARVYLMTEFELLKFM